MDEDDNILPFKLPVGLDKIDIGNSAVAKDARMPGLHERFHHVIGVLQEVQWIIREHETEGLLSEDSELPDMYENIIVRLEQVLDGEVRT